MTAIIRLSDAAVARLCEGWAAGTETAGIQAMLRQEFGVSLKIKQIARKACSYGVRRPPKMIGDVPDGLTMFVDLYTTTSMSWEEIGDSIFAVHGISVRRDAQKYWAKKLSITRPKHVAPIQTGPVTMEDISASRARADALNAPVRRQAEVKNHCPPPERHHYPGGYRIGATSGTV